MADSPYRVGYDLTAKVNYQDIKEATKAAGEFVNQLQRIDKLQGGGHAGSATNSMQRNMKSASQEAQNLTAKTKTAATAQAQLSDAVKKTNDSGKGMKYTSDNVRSVGEYSKTAAGQTNLLQRSIAKIKDVGTQSFKAVSEHVKRFGETSEATRKRLDRLNETGKRFRDAGYSMLPVSAALGASFLKGAKDATELQNRYTIVKNLLITGGESTRHSITTTNKMMAAGRSYSLKYGVSQKEIGAGYEELVRRGYTANQALAAQKTLVQGSIASGDAYNDVVHNSTAAIESFGLRSKNTATMTRNTKKAVNEMAYAADLTATDFKGMGNALQYVGAISHGANQSLSETSAAIGVLSNNGQEASVAGTGLRQVLSRLTNPPAKGKYVGAMKQLGLSAGDFKDAKGNLLSLQDIFTKLNKTMTAKGMTGTQKTSIYGALFGQTGMTTAKILGANVGQMKALNTQITKASNQKGGGYVAGLSKRNMDSWQTQFKRFKASIDQLGMSFAKSVLPTLVPMVKQLNNMVNAFGKMPKPMKQAVAYGTAFVALAGPLMVGAGSVMSAASTLGVGASKIGLTGAVGKVGKAFLPAALKDSKAAAPVVGDVVADAGKSGLFKSVARRIPWLGTALSATSLIGINKKNAGSKIGDFGGSMAGMTAGASAGAALGSVIPGVGTAIGGFVGGAAGGIAGSSLGKKAGAWFQKEIPGIKKSLSGSISAVGKWFGKEWNGIGKFFGGVGKGFNNKLVKPVAGAFKAVIKTANGLRVTVGHAIALPFEFAAGLVHRYIVKPLEKPVGEALSWVAKKWRGFAKTAGNLWRAIGSAVGKAWRSGLKSISRGWNTMSKWLGKSWSSFAGVVGKYWSRITAPMRHAFHSAVGYVEDIWRGATNWLGKEWNGLSKTAGNVFSAVGSAIEKPIKAAWNYISGIFDKIGSAVGKVTSKVSNFVGGIAKWAGGVTKEGRQVLGKANGGLIASQTTALVGEGGPELAYTVNGRKARLLGAAGPQFAKVKPGERILKARDTQKVLSGGLGHVLPGYATGNTSLGTTKADKSVNKFGSQSKSTWNKTEKETAKSTKKISKNTVADYDTLQKGSVKQLNQLENGNNSRWKNIVSTSGKRTDSMRKSTVHDYNVMQQDSQKQMNQLHDGVISAANATAVGFGKAMYRMKGFAHTAMGGAIGQLNQGISGIDSVLGQFGGNHSVIKPIKYAHGSNGQLTENQMAMVNDATAGPRQELIVRNNNVYAPQGKNRVLPLHKGDQVLNGRQSQEFAAMQGIAHYAKGSGVSKSGLRKIADTNSSHPTKAFNNEYNVHIDLGGSTLQKGSTALGKNSSNKLGPAWSKAMWGVIQDAIQGGGSAAGGNWRHSPGAGFHVTSGFGYRGATAGGMADHDGNDFSGAKTVHSVHGGTVIYAGGAPANWGGGNGIGENLVTKGSDGWYVIYQEFNGKNNSGAPMYVHRGDTVKTGQRVAALGPSGTHVHIGVSRHNPFSNSGSTTAGWNDLLKMHGHSSGTPKSRKSDGRLTKLAKAELGKSALSWVSKHLSTDTIGNIGNMNLVGDLGTRVRTLAAAFRKLYPATTTQGITAVLGNWKFESGGLNPAAINSGGGASGLGQWYKGRATALRNYARRHGTSWKNPATQLKFALSGDGANSAILRRILRSHDSYASLAAEFSNEWERGGHTGQHVSGARDVAAALEKHANGGWAKKGKVNVFGEAGNSEVAINPKRNSADSLINQTIEARADADKSSSSADYLKSVKAMKVSHRRPKIEPKIEININGDISDERMLKKVTDIFERKLGSAFSKINDEFGLDDSVW